MKVFTHNFNPNSNSGPNKFTRTLFSELIKDNKIELSSQEEADVEFCLIQQQVDKVKPMVLRLDGIWFNSDQNYKIQNLPIQYSYQRANAVVFQSNFNKKLTEHWFGHHENSHVIHNAPDLGLIAAANSNFWNEKLGKDTEVWSCASSWRPHKRLNENIRYFLEFAPKDAIFAIAGALGMDDAKKIPKDNRIVLMGDLDYMSLLSLYRRSTTFVHLAYLDHCPNVVVDAQAAGCKIICSSTGGTSEIVRNGTIIHEKEWNFEPIRLYSPPHISWDKTFRKKDYEEGNKPSIVNCAKKYFKIMENLN